MPHILYILFFAMSLLLLPQVSFIRDSGLPQNNLRMLLSLKILTGALLGWLTYKYYPGNDYWSLHNEGLTEWKLLKQQPKAFFEGILYSPYANKYGGFFNAVGSYWNDLRNNIIVKLLAFLNMASMGNFYINSLMMNCIGFLGHVALFRIFKQIYPQQKTILIVGCFLIPTTLYFSSGIHKDLIVFTALCGYAYLLFISITDKISVKRLCLLVVCFGMLVLMRNFLAMALIPSTLIYFLIEKQKLRPRYVLLGIFSGLLLLSFLLEYFFPDFSPYQIIAQRQHDFSLLTNAQSSIQLTRLEPNFYSFIKLLPEAVNHGFLRPYVWETKNIFSLILSIELLIMELLLIIVIIKKWNQRCWNAFIYFGLALGMVMLLINGYIIPNTSSLVRYRSLYLPLLITPLLCGLFKNKGQIK